VRVRARHGGVSRGSCHAKILKLFGHPIGACCSRTFTQTPIPPSRRHVSPCALRNPSLIQNLPPIPAQIWRRSNSIRRVGCDAVACARRCRHRSSVSQQIARVQQVYWSAAGPTMKPDSSCTTGPPLRARTAPPACCRPASAVLSWASRGGAAATASLVVVREERHVCDLDPTVHVLGSERRRPPLKDQGEPGGRGGHR
jgi:hypothetical protein